MNVYSLFALIGTIALGLYAIRYILQKPKHLVFTYIQFFVGTLFIFSGAVKAIDPLGTSYKMHDYFSAFSQFGLKDFWALLSDWSTPLAVFMIVFEIVLGIAILIGWQTKLTLWLSFAMLIFFTILTGFTYLNGYDWQLFFSKGNLVFEEKNMKVTDCGCFGDFVKLKPWVSFYKDIFLDILIVILIAGSSKIEPLFSNIVRHTIIVVSTVGTWLFCLSNYVWNLPIVDFRPYKPGNNIRELRKEKVPPKTEMTFIYKNTKTGAEKEFGMNELTAINSEEWEFKDRKDKVLDPGVPAVITNLFISDEHKNDITDQLLNDPNYSLMIVAYKLGKTNEAAFKQLNALAEKTQAKKLNVYCVTSGDINIEDFRTKNQTAYPFYTADETPLKTIIRSNPGLVLLKNGVVKAMWHHNHLPTFETLEKDYLQ
ncbi:MAG: DoxX family protein [Chitinophagales bacterium]|nr:DoxX family protein [Chitinophagales bacterium]